MTSSSFADRWKRAPPLASIESLLSFEAKSTPRSENNTLHEIDNLRPSLPSSGQLQQQATQATTASSAAAGLSLGLYQHRWGPFVKICLPFESLDSLGLKWGLFLKKWWASLKEKIIILVKNHNFYLKLIIFSSWSHFDWNMSFNCEFKVTTIWFPFVHQTA